MLIFFSRFDLINLININFNLTNKYINMFGLIKNQHVKIKFDWLIYKYDIYIMHRSIRQFNVDLFKI